MTQVLEPLCTVYHRVFKMKKSTRRKCESSRRTIAPRKRCLAVLEGKCRRGIPPPAGGGGGGSQQIFKFCIPRDAFWCIFRAKKCLFGSAEPQIVSGSC